MNHDNEYHESINYGNRFADDWYFLNPEDSLVNKYNQQEEKQRKYCYKPYRTLHNY